MVEQLGAETFAYVRIEGQSANLTLRLPGETILRPGTSIGIKPDWRRVHWFDGRGRTLASDRGEI